MVDHTQHQNVWGKPAAFTRMSTLTFVVRCPAPCASVPDCLFLAGFDQLMLGYEKTENPFLPQAYMREIFLSSGIVRPVILVCGTAVGWWNLKNKTLTVNLFTDADRDLIAGAACCQWPQLRHIHFPKRTS